MRRNNGLFQQNRPKADIASAVRNVRHGAEPCQ
jgi:hypothetical protein